MDEPSEGKNYGRIIWVYGFAILMMLVMVQLLSNLLPAFFLLRQAESDPALKETIKTLSESRSPDWAPDETELAKHAEDLAPLYGRLNWFGIGLISSILVFSAIGFFVGVYSEEPAGAGLLPFLAVLIQSNPATMPNLMEYHGFTGIGLSFGQQASLLLVQMAFVYTAAGLGDRRRRMLDSH